MTNKHTELFDLQVIMMQGDLNIRAAAAGKPDMTARGYFDMLSEMRRSAPEFIEDLDMLLSRESDRHTLKRLTRMIALLTDLGYDKDTINFDSLLDAYDSGHPRLTARYAKKIMENFDMLLSRVSGACITELPESVHADPETVALKDWINAPRKEGAGDKPVIVAIDDSPVILRSVSSLLSGEYKVYMLANSAMLEKTLSQIKPDLFLLDYRMPDINGFELVPIIRRYSAHKDTPIIFLTSEGTVDNLSVANKLGACDFIVKPVQPDVLREIIAKHLNRKAA